MDHGVYAPDTIKKKRRRGKVPLRTNNVQVNRFMMPVDDLARV